MSEMVERVARALWAQRQKWSLANGVLLGDWGDGSVPLSCGLVEEACEAIFAMREPPKFMDNAYWELNNVKGATYHSGADAKEVWRSAIVQCLGEDVPEYVQVIVVGGVK